MSINDFAERRQFRERETVTCDAPEIAYRHKCVCGRPLDDGHSHPELFERHTVDLAGTEQHISDEIYQLNALAFHIRAKMWGAFTTGLLLGGGFGWFVLPHLLHGGAP